jgi:hypothetical protein
MKNKTVFSSPDLPQRLTMIMKNEWIPVILGGVAVPIMYKLNSFSFTNRN